jgi:hypothetical protein
MTGICASSAMALDSHAMTQAKLYANRQGEWE